MKNLDWDKIPSFDQLPVKKGAPPESSWGVFGDDDQFGCLNFLTPQGVIDAARLVQNGKVFRLDAKIGFAKPTLFGRATVAHKVVPLAPFANDDVVDNFNTQEGSQWDGLAHVGHRWVERYYNGVQSSEIGPGGKLSIHEWAARFVGRGVLIDAFGFRKAKGRHLHPLERDVIHARRSERRAGVSRHDAQTPARFCWSTPAGWRAMRTVHPEQKRPLTSFENVRSRRD